jgi:hypothetical protein
VNYDYSGRHPSVREKCRWLDPHPNLSGVARAVAYLLQETRNELLDALEDGPQLTLGLQHLVDAKDCLVRQAVADQGPP